jgi:hypothetical protein
MSQTINSKLKSKFKNKMLKTSWVLRKKDVLLTSEKFGNKKAQGQSVWALWAEHYDLPFTCPMGWLWGTLPRRGTPYSLAALPGEINIYHC